MTEPNSVKESSGVIRVIYFVNTNTSNTVVRKSLVDA